MVQFVLCIPSVFSLSRHLLAHPPKYCIFLQMSSKLKVLNLTSCRCLTKMPDFSSCLALERVILKDCKSLTETDSSIGKLQHLSHLTIDGCNSLRKLPDEVSSIRSLTSLVMENIMGKGTNSVKGDSSVGFKLPELIWQLELSVKP